MPMSNKERQKKYREKHKDDAVLKNRRKTENKRYQFKKKNEELEAKIKSGDLNAGLPKVKGEFMTWEEFKDEFRQLHDREPDFKLDYMTKKEEFKRQQDVDFEDAWLNERWNIINIVPLNPKNSDKCRLFRAMRMGLISRDAFFYNGHVSCPYCKKWIVLFKEKYNYPSGANIF